MVRKKLDNRIRVLLENCVITGHRSLFVVVGDKGRDQVVILHHILSKASYKARPNVLWCYKKELGFSSHRKKRMKQVQKKIKSGNLNANEDDPFELFIASTQIRYCYYSETHKILGNTFGMCVLQDFEALTPNLLARTIETVEGGGCVVILLRSVSSLRQLYTMAMDVHARYRTESHQDVIGRFNERFILSLSACRNCMVVDDQLNILPISTHILNIEAVPLSKKDEIGPNDEELKQLKESLRDTQPVGVLINCCKTLDQAKAVLKFIDVITEKTLRATVTLTAARGRGKSAALGLAMAGAVAFGYSNIFVTSPSPENLSTLFDFVFKGFDVLEYQEHIDYELIQSTNPEFNKAIVRVNIFREHRQTIQYIHPADAAKLGQAELVVIDEAAAIPLPLVRELMGPYLVFMSSTINGYEGTGRSLSLKLIQQLREQTLTSSGASKSTSAGSEKQMVGVTGRQLHEIVLEESIRYKPGDDVEKWLNGLLCLEVANVPKLMSGCPIPQDCDLYYINRDTLFCYHKASELFLQRLMSIYVAAHYKNSPNDLQLLSDAPAHHLFCLLGPVNPNQKTLPEVLCVVQLCLEGEISKTSVVNSLARGKRSAGDLIPWTVAQQFQDDDFPSLSGARVVRIATHPDYQSMGYGSRALQLLQDYYEGKIQSITEEEENNGDTKEEIEATNAENFSLLEESVAPRKNLPPLLLKLSERKAERLDYIGVSFGLTSSLLKFWKRNSYTPVYLRQTPNELTGEHTCIMIRSLADNRNSQWLKAYWKDFRRRFIHLLGFQFRKFSPAMCINLLHQKQFDSESNDMLTKAELDYFLSGSDMKRLELYSQNLVDYHLITDLMPIVSQLIFTKRIEIQLSAVQMAIMLGVGLQFQTIDDLVKILDLPSTQLLALFNRAVRKIVQILNGVCEKAVEVEMGEERVVIMEPTAKSLQEDLDEAADEFTKQQKKRERKELLKDTDDLSQYAIRGDDTEWSEALQGGKKNPGGIVSVKSTKTMDKRPQQEDFEEKSFSGKTKKKQKRK